MFDSDFDDACADHDNSEAYGPGLDGLLIGAASGGFVVAVIAVFYFIFSFPH